MFETLGHYRILDRIGEGGMGEVYRARDTRLGRTVAIKVLPATVAGDGERRERFLQEARDAIGIAADRLGQDLDRDVALQLRIARAIHLAHAAGADRVEDLERTKPRAGREAHPRQILMPKVSAAGEDHREAVLVGRGNHLGVAH